MTQRGFTLIEVLVAFSIAATALLVMMGRLGASADLQRSLTAQTLMLTTAQDILERCTLQHLGNDYRSTSGEIDVGDIRLNWETSYKQAMQAGLVRQNVEVQVPGEGHVTLFRYRKAE